MKHLKKFNESKSEMQLEDYFVEFVDEGFTIERELNQFKLKYTIFVGSSVATIHIVILLYISNCCLT